MTTDSTFTPGERALWQTAYRAADRILEYGAGETTRFACSHERSIRSIEADPEWVERIEADPEVEPALAAERCQVVHVDIGPVRDWSFPSDETRRDHWPDYPRAGWRDSETFDLVFVDGRFRVACTLQAVLNGTRQTPIIIHDFWNRPEYHPVLDHVQVARRQDTMALVYPRADIDRQSVDALFERYKFNPE